MQKSRVDSTLHSCTNPLREVTKVVYLYYALFTSVIAKMNGGVKYPHSSSKRVPWNLLLDFSPFWRKKLFNLEDFQHMAMQTETVVEVPGFPWWILLLEGIVALIVGIYLITAPGSTSVFLVTVLGFYWLIRGIFSIIEIFLPYRTTHWGWLLFMGILGIAAGLIVLRHPIYATAIAGTFIIVFLAVDGLIMGIMGLIRAFTGDGWGPGILGILSIIISIFLFVNLYSAVSVLPIVLGAFLIVGGIIAIFYAFRIRRA